MNITKIDANSIDWLMVTKVVMEDRVRWAVNAFMPHEAPSPESIYPMCLQKGLDLIIKNLIKVYRA